jgi:large subunit ribosomal protein L46
VVSPALNPQEAAMMEMLRQVELEDSMLSDHEVRHKQDEERLEKKRRGEVLEGEEEAVITALDMEDAWKKEASVFTAAERTTAADKADDRRSVQRRLDAPLRLITQIALCDKKYWVLPNNVRAEGETMREAAERALRAHCGPHMPFSVLGHAPLTFYKYKYPRRYRESSQRQGAKVFVYKAYLTAAFGDPVVVEPGPGVHDYSLDHTSGNGEPSGARCPKSSSYHSLL